MAILPSQYDNRQQCEALDKHRNYPAVSAGIVSACDERRTHRLDPHNRTALQLGCQLRIRHEQTAWMLKHQREAAVTCHLHRQAAGFGLIFDFSRDACDHTIRQLDADVGIVANIHQPVGLLPETRETNHTAVVNCIVERG